MYIIAEIGQNHNGNFRTAKDLIHKAYLGGANAVKFAKRYMPYELTPEAYNRPYKSKNSFGKTYGEHREFLEFDFDQMRELKKYAEDMGLDFILSVCDTISLKMAVLFGFDKLKIPSKDVRNMRLLKEAARQTDVYWYLSTGMISVVDLESVLEESNFKPNVIFHCVSEYPCSLTHCNLGKIRNLKNGYWSKFAKIGYSCHCRAMDQILVAIGMGIEVLEVHFTFNRHAKGSDHLASFTVDDLSRLAVKVINAEMAIKTDREVIYGTGIPEYVKPAADKLMPTKQKDGIWRIE